jgi:hypothetical protein
MAWYDGELFPVQKDWVNAPYDIAGCEHERGVVAPKDKVGDPANPGNGCMYLHCMVCDLSWQEPLGNIKGSPWEGK